MFPTRVKMAEIVMTMQITTSAPVSEVTLDITVMVS